MLNIISSYTNSGNHGDATMVVVTNGHMVWELQSGTGFFAGQHLAYRGVRLDKGPLGRRLNPNFEKSMQLSIALYVRLGGQATITLPSFGRLPYVKFDVDSDGVYFNPTHLRQVEGLDITGYPELEWILRNRCEFKGSIVNEPTFV